MNIGPMEIVIVLVLALLIFGPKQLPQAGRSLGHAVREFKKATAAARSELGLDEVTKGIKEVKGGISDIKSSTTIDLNLADKKSTPAPDPSAASTPAPAEAAAAVAVTADAAPTDVTAGVEVTPPAAGEPAGAPDTLPPAALTAAEPAADAPAEPAAPQAPEAPTGSDH